PSPAAPRPPPTPRRLRRCAGPGGWRWPRPPPRSPPPPWPSAGAAAEAPRNGERRLAGRDGAARARRRLPEDERVGDGHAALGLGEARALDRRDHAAAQGRAAARGLGARHPAVAADLDLDLDGARAAVLFAARGHLAAHPADALGDVAAGEGLGQVRRAAPRAAARPALAVLLAARLVGLDQARDLVAA